MRETMTTDFDKQTRAAIRRRMFDLQERGVRTSKGEPLSFAAIGRTCEPRVSRAAVCLVAAGCRRTERIRLAIERELAQPFWVHRSDDR